MDSPNQPSDIGKMLFANNIIKDSENTHTNPGAGFPNSGGKNGGMGGNIDDTFKFGEGGGIDISMGSLDGVLSLLKGNGGVFEADLFAWADGALAMGKISYHDFFEMAKKMGLKLDVSVVKETGADLGANMAIISGGQGQGQGH